MLKKQRLTAYIGPSKNSNKNNRLISFHISFRPKRGRYLENSGGRSMHVIVDLDKRQRIRYVGRTDREFLVLRVFAFVPFACREIAPRNLPKLRYLLIHNPPVVCREDERYRAINHPSFHSISSLDRSIIACRSGRLHSQTPVHHACLLHDHTLPATASVLLAFADFHLARRSSASCAASSACCVACHLLVVASDLADDIIECVIDVDAGFR